MLHVEIRVKGTIDRRWADWFEGLAITAQEPAETALSGDVLDQSALYGLLASLRDLRFDLRSVEVREIEDGRQGMTAGQRAPGSSTGG